MDVSAEKMIYGVAGIDPQRRDELIKVRTSVFFSCKMLCLYLFIGNYIPMGFEPTA